MPKYAPDKVSERPPREAREKGSHYKRGTFARLTERDKLLLRGIEQIIEVFHGEPEPCECGVKTVLIDMYRKRYRRCEKCGRVWHETFVEREGGVM